MQLQIDKSRVASSFSKAAATYDGSSLLQRDVGNELLKLVNSFGVNTLENGTVVDLGCGTGYFTGQLEASLKPKQLIGLDIAEGMLEYARSFKESHYQWLCADAEALPLSENSIDCLFSSLAIQWCETPRNLFGEIERVLNKEGVAFISTLGPESLSELRHSWASIDKQVHVNRFVHLDSLIQDIPDGLELIICEKQMREIEYNKLNELTSDLKNIGAHNMNAGEGKGLTGRVKINQLKSNYEQYRKENGKLPASYEVYYLALKKK